MLRVYGGEWQKRSWVVDGKGVWVEASDFQYGGDSVVFKAVGKKPKERENERMW